MYKWLDERLDLHRLNSKLFRKAFPVHHTFFLGEITLFAFVVLVLTGVFLTLNYEPSIREVTTPDGQKLPAAYASILYIDSLPFGAVIRSLHHWSAHIMIAAAFLHMIRIHLSGAYKKPRELNWLVGIGLLVLAIVTAFTGYALPFDNYAITATKIGYEIGAAAPWVGGVLVNILFAGEFSNTNTQMIPRLFSVHVLWLPLTLIALIGLHLLIMVKQKHTQPKYAERVSPGKILGVPALPSQGIMAGILFLVYVAVATLIAGIFLAHPVQAYGPPTANTPAVKPDWYFLWIYGILQMIPSNWKFELLGATFGPQFWGGIFVPTLIILGAAAIPFIDTQPHKQRYLELPSQHPGRTSFVIGMLMFYIMATLAGYKIDLNLPNALLWVLVLFVPILTGVVAYVILRAFYGKASQESQVGGLQGSAADD
ncbi:MULTISPECIES: cytochrome bc complex cytochrome b subunit [unclassified Meiothermus]|uniref:cytochrome b n=1 Tax=unclassified Meiothermus TaxID=370471 RepID=UPI000D7C2741|nr:MULTISPECIES: cytochrome bc complex cytochrome b subunit [unclassified Meiothermus]PZA06241.1 cytochrome bc complex cytochrome b subunit [Meiothermus sp. Pnk-1]RYM39515.1 cytochrome bc complex cytochrome b subunit [Meiothermus sp. PNK-Is4]